MATHSIILAWKIPWTEEPDDLESVRSKESDMTSNLTHTYTYIHIYVHYLLNSYGIHIPYMYSLYTYLCIYSLYIYGHLLI